MHIGIAGAGLMGRLLAWQLLRSGHRVTLFDSDRRDGQRAAARVAAAMLAPYSEIVAGEREVFDWGREGLVLWRTLLRDLQSDTGEEVYFQQRGSLVVAHRQDAGNLRHFNQQLQRLLPSPLQQVRFLQREALAELEPELAASFSEATFLEEEGTLDNRELLAALATAIGRQGGEWHEVTEVESVGCGTIMAAGRLQRFDLAIDARGFGARGQWPELRGVRGEVLWVHAPEVRLSRPVRLMHPRYQLYIAPKRGDVYVIGATQIESESLEPITVRSSLELLSALYSVHTGFAEAQLLHAFANCRPAFPDHLPRIEVAPGLMRVNGLYRHGYLLAPVVLHAALVVVAGGPDHAIVRRTADQSR